MKVIKRIVVVALAIMMIVPMTFVSLKPVDAAGGSSTSATNTPDGSADSFDNGYVPSSPVGILNDTSGDDEPLGPDGKPFRASLTVQLPVVTNGEDVFCISYDLLYPLADGAEQQLHLVDNLWATSGGKATVSSALPAGTIYTVSLDAPVGYMFEQTSWSGTVGLENILIEPALIAEPKDAKIFSAKADGVTVSAIASPDTGFSEDTEFHVDKLGADAIASSGEAIRENIVFPSTSSLYLMLYDVYFVKDGVRVQPAAGTVELTFMFDTAPFADELEAAKGKTDRFIVHIKDDGSVEKLSHQWVSDTELKLTATSFSVMGPALIVSESIPIYTLDGEYQNIYVPKVPDGMTDVVYASTMEEAFTHLAAGGTVWLTENVGMNVIGISGAAATVQSYDGVYTLTKTGSAENMFVLTDGATLTLENVVVDAADNIFGRTVTVDTGSTFVLNAGAVLENNVSYGAVSMDASSIYIDGGIIRNNMAVGNSGGGILMSHGCSLTFVSGEFSNNVAVNGGAIYADTLESGSMIMTGGKFSGNRAEGGDWSGGGSIVVYGDASAFTISISGVLFENSGNLAKWGLGGAILFNTTTNLKLTVDNSEFSGGTGRHGAAISFYNSDNMVVTITDSRFNNNISVQRGAISVEANNPKLTITGCTFTGNTCNLTDATWNSQGGAVWVGVTRTGGDILFENCTFAKNKARQHGAAVYCQGGSDASSGAIVTLKGCTFEENQTTFGYAGGFGSSNGVKTIDIVDCTFRNNKSLGHGGAVAIYNSTNSVTLTIDGGTFTGNYSQWYGGAFETELHNGTVIVKGDALFENNTADCAAGAIYVARTDDSSTVQVIFESCRILNNVCTGKFLVVRAMNAKFALANEHYHAGGVYIGEDCTLYLTDALVTDNRVEGMAGDTIGNGITLCPNGSGYFYSEHGAAIYDNGSTAGMDILAVPHDEAVSHENPPRLYVSDVAPDGQAYNWTDLDGEEARTGYYDWDKALEGIATFAFLDDADTGDYDGEDNLDPVGFKAHMSGIMLADAESSPKVIISGNVSRNDDRVPVVYGAGGIMVNGNILAGDFNITVKKKVEFTDDVSAEERAEIQDREFKFELRIWDTHKYNSNRYLESVRVLCDSSLYGEKEVPTRVYVSPTANPRTYATGIAIDFTLKADERVTFSFDWDDGKDPFAHRSDIHFQLFEVDAGGALSTEITYDRIYSIDNRNKLQTLAYTCTNTFGEPDVGELDISKTVDGPDRDSFWSFDITVGKSVAEGVLQAGQNYVTFVNGKAESVDMPAVIASDYEPDPLEAFLTVTNNVTDDSGQTFRYTYRIFDDNGNETKGSFSLAPGESRVFGSSQGWSGVTGTQWAGYHYIVTQEPVEGFDSRVSIDGTYSVELWENGTQSHLTGENGGIEFTDGIGTVTFVNGMASVQLKHGQTLKIKGLEADLDYSVTEREANAEGYATTETDTVGKIPLKGVAAAAFVNMSLTVVMPSTGGIGMASVIFGSLFVCGVGIGMILLAVKQKRRESRAVYKQ